MKGIKNIIFDLGGVLLDIDYKMTTTAFEAIGYPAFDDLFSQNKASPLFEGLETGKVEEKEFLKQMRFLSSRPVTDEQIITAWNAMMISFRKECLVFLEELSTRYNLYLLSNTNSIHLKCFQEIFTRDTGKSLLDVYFNKAWYSHLVGLRKPHPEIYKFALQEGDMVPAETFFIDDTAANVETALNLGIKTHLLLSTERIEQLGL